MADCTKETEMGTLKTLLEAALAASYPGAYEVTRNAAKDPESFGNGVVAVYLMAGASQPPEGDCNVLSAVTVPVSIIMRVAFAPEEASTLETLMNNAEACILSGLSVTKYLVKSCEREVSLNCIWEEIQISFQTKVA